jgi:hypothetical protein
MTAAPTRSRRRSRGRAERFRRLLRYRLVVPVLRSRHSPEHTARGVAMGVFWGLTPTVGLQTLAILGTWAALRPVWHFSLVQTLAWTWINNPITMVPLYYGFYLTGQWLLGRGGDAAGYDAFASLFAGSTEGTVSFADRTMAAIRALGWPTLLGCLPWSLAGGVMSYRWSLRFLRRRAELRVARRRAALP